MSKRLCKAVAYATLAVLVAGCGPEQEATPKERDFIVVMDMLSGCTYTIKMRQWKHFRVQKALGPDGNHICGEKP